MSEEKSFEAQLQSINNDINHIDQAIHKLNTKRQKLLTQKEQIKKRIQEEASEKLASQNWERCDHPWSKKVDEVLKTVFKLNKFRPYQLSTINAVMSKHDCILLMPTGGGKSLCYQLPAMVLDGITLVVSPLVSLMEDQIMAMESLNVPAALLNANSSREHVNYVHSQMTEKKPSLKLLYVTPEKLAKSKRFMAKLEKMYKMGSFSLLAIDEVHCCSQWGHDFRTDYKFLGIMKRQFPKVPILGLTATATSSVIADVQNILNIQGCLVLKASFNRPNLKYEVFCKSSNQKDNVGELENMLSNRFNGLSGIIYCFSVKDSEEIASELRKRSIKAQAYHAQLDAKSRSSVHKSWASNRTQVIVATVAFGMGIDKPDVRFVIHYSMPKSMENFYQESGRAGRDDNLATCILFFRFPDVFRQSTMVFTEQKGLEHLYAMVAYCLDLSRCRRAIIAQHFGERWESSDCNNMCDHCDNYGPYVETQKNISKEYRILCDILNHSNMIDERLTSQKLIESWTGKGPPKLRPPGLSPTLLSRENCERIIALLLLESYLIEEFHFTPYSTISYINIGSRKPPKNDELLLPMPCLKAKVQNSSKNGVHSSSNKSTKEDSSSAKSDSSKIIKTKPASENSKVTSLNKKNKACVRQHIN
ncbi:LOW QUALITY PROTEIN: ATP-dependent DNA helicase Q1-like [Uloborus diversus]|uniref:LOW QUALITY PROTEIN: ATP-dependent DNA helicase Q1-like n=1 Tax=Uloborus diversus TaxID=327109 RepID=UPI00240A74D1|nr:LOW QUALITY PROTEIN: ATP-dependent DNA helicase Q1-like [Uloborus diversus]